MKTSQPATREFTGRHMLYIMLAFFGVIITVNVTMATLANTTWTGLVVPNSYIASQEFNGKAAAGRAQAALGWTSEWTIADGEFIYRLVDANGQPVAMDRATATFRRPAHEGEDLTIELRALPGGGVAGDVAPADGAWMIEVNADARLDAPYREVRRLFLREGIVR
jgi:nitrogen fixation protein FixH